MDMLEQVENVFNYPLLDVVRMSKVSHGIELININSIQTILNITVELRLSGLINVKGGPDKQISG